MGFNKIRNYQDKIVDMTGFLLEQDYFLAIKDKFMSILEELFPCEELSLNLLLKEDSSLTLLAYTNNTSTLSDNHRKDALRIDSQQVYHVHLSAYPDLVHQSLHEKKYLYLEGGTESPNSKAVFPILDQGDVLGFIRFVLKAGQTLDEEDLRFLEQFTRLLALAVKISEQKKILFESEMREREMSLAFDMQQKVMSENNVPFFRGGKISYFYKYGEASDYMPYLSKRLGGDYCEIIQIDDQKALIFIADVMGHGMPSNYFVSMMKGVFKTCVNLNIKDTDDLLIKMNTILMKELDKSNLFITAQALFIDFEKKIVRISNAGHPEPILLGYRDGEFQHDFIRGNQGIPLGIDEDFKFTRRQINVRNYDTILLYTDGILEATSWQGEEFGVEGILEFCRERGKLDTELLIHSLYDRVLEFSYFNEDAKLDDILLLAVSLGK